MQHYVYVAWNVQTFGLCFPRFLQQVDILVLFTFLTILRQIPLTPQEVGDWFGCGKKKKKKKGSCFLKGKEFGCIFFFLRKKRKFIFKILSDSVFEEKKKGSCFLKGKEFGCFFFF